MWKRAYTWTCAERVKERAPFFKASTAAWSNPPQKLTTPGRKAQNSLDDCKDSWIRALMVGTRGELQIGRVGISI